MNCRTALWQEKRRNGKTECNYYFTALISTVAVKRSRMSSRGLLSVVLRNVNRAFINSSSCNRICHYGESSVLFADSDRSKGLRLSFLAASKIPDPPKRPVRSFVAYLGNRWRDLLKVQSGLRSKDVIKQAAVEWGALSIEEKKPYTEAFEIEYAKYKILKEKWWNDLTDEQRDKYNNSKQEMKRIKDQKEFKKSLRLLGKPKRPGNSYAYYIAQIDANSIKTGQTLFNYASETWKLMPDVDKQPFVNEANTDQLRYKKELLVWEKKMLKEGNEEYVHRRMKAEKHAETTDKRSLDSTGKNKKKTPTK